MLASTRHRRAVVLLVSVAVLSVLAILATVFATMSRIERSIARNYVDLVRAKLLAVAGIEAGSKVLRQPTSVPAGRFAYLGEDHNASGDLANAWGVTEDVYRPGGAAGTLQVLDCPLSYALRPSLFADLNADGRPDVMTVIDPTLPGGTRQVGYSGVLAGTYQQFGDTYSVKIVDQNDLLDINDVMVNPASGVPVESLGQTNTRLARVINTAAQALGLPGNEGTLIANWRLVNAPVGLQTRLVSGNPEITGVTGGFISVEQIAGIPGFPAASYRVLKEYLTTNSWKDLSTICPKPQTLSVVGGGVAPCNSYYCKQENPPPDKYDFRFRFEPRAPVNVNTAPWAILAALVSGLQANYVAVVPTAFPSVSTETERYEVRTTSIPAYSGVASTAGRIASTIVWYRNGANGPFRTWEQWNDFVDNNLAQGGNPFGSPIITDLQGKILKGAFNPNTRWMRANPDRCVRSRRNPSGTNPDVDVDKTDLAVYSTELCFSSKGTFALSSLGRVVDEIGNVVALYEIKTVAKAFDVVRHTTARDFRRGSPMLSGMQYVAILPDNMYDQSAASGATGEDRELGPAFDVPIDDPRWAYDGGVTERTQDPDPFSLDNYTWPSTYAWGSTVPNRGGGMLWETNPISGPATPPMGLSAVRPREDRSVFGPPAGYPGPPPPPGPGDSIKGDIFGDGIYLGSDRYRGLTYALPWAFSTASQPGSNSTGMSIDYWMKPNCEGSTQTSMRRGYDFVRSDLGTQTLQYKILRATGGGLSWDGVRYLQFTCHYWDQVGAMSHGGQLRLFGSSNWDLNSWSGPSIVTSAPNEKSGVLWDWRSAGGPNRLFTGMWHHFYLGTWDEGYYTAGNMYVDGVLQPGALARYGAPGSGFYATPWVIQVGNNITAYCIYQEFSDLGSLVDVANCTHDLSPLAPASEPFGQDGQSDTDRFLSGTLDAFRVRRSQSPPASVPNRLTPGYGIAGNPYAQFGQRIDRTIDPADPNKALLPTKEMPANGGITIMSCEWTRYCPSLAYNGSTLSAANRPTTRFRYGVVGGGFPYTLADTTGRPQSLTATGLPPYQITSSQVLQYQIQFTNPGALGKRESAYFDDVTFNYYVSSNPVQYLSWQVTTGE